MITQLDMGINKKAAIEETQKILTFLDGIHMKAILVERFD